MLLDQVAQRNRHFLFDCAWVVDVTRNTEQFGAAVIWSSERGEPARTPSHDGWADCDGLHVRDGSGAGIQAAVGREGWFQTGFALLAFEAF